MRLGKDVKLAAFINLYGCHIGDETKIGAFVEIQKGATDRQPVQDLEPHVHLRRRDHRRPRRSSVTALPSSTIPIRARRRRPAGSQTAADWKVEPTLVKNGASIGSGATDPLERRHRRTRHRRRRGRRDARRASKRDSRRQPCTGAAIGSA